MSKVRNEKGQFVRTTPDYKALYEAECDAHNREKEAFLGKNEECKKLQKTIEKQQSTISELTADLHRVKSSMETAEKEHERALNKMWRHMGWFKRWTYTRKEAK